MNFARRRRKYEPSNLVEKIFSAAIRGLREMTEHALKYAFRHPLTKQRCTIGGRVNTSACCKDYCLSDLGCQTDLMQPFNSASISPILI